MPKETNFPVPHYKKENLYENRFSSQRKEKTRQNRDEMYQILKWKKRREQLRKKYR